MSRTTTIIISLLSVLVIGVFLIWPKYQEVSALRFGIGERRTELQYKEKYFSDLERISEEMKEYQLELSKIDSALPPNPSLPSLLDFLQKTAAQSGLILRNLGSFSITSPEENPRIKEIRFPFSLSGSYSSFKNFLSSLEKTSRLIEVENISFSFVKEKPAVPAEEISLSFDLKIKVHSY